jgi:type IV secretory pathway TrbF-like protein
MENDRESPLLTGYVDQLARIEAASSDELARIENAYREIQRRDGAAWWHAQNWRRVALVLIAALLVAFSIITVLAIQKSRVQAFVQPVQLTEENRMVLVGTPVDLFAYEPQEGEWMNMLAEWVRKYRWRGDEDAMIRTKHDWEWLRRHTCGAASKQLVTDEKRLDPYKKGKRTSVDLKASTKTDTPQSYQVIWEETRADIGLAHSEPRRYTGTFTVSRLRPSTMGELLDNRLGQCVNGYMIDPRIGSY